MSARQEASFIAPECGNDRSVVRVPFGGATPERVRADGKFFARGRRRFRVQGVTYGPFAPNPGGEPFPDPGRVADDFSLMQSAGVNALRTYHVPPAWLLRQADEAGLGVF